VSGQRYRTGRRGTPPLEPVLALVKEGYVIAARLGTPLEPTVYIAAHTRYERRVRSMELTVATLVHGELQPGGSVAAMIDRLVELEQHAIGRVGQAGVSLYVDVTRSPQVYRMAAEAIPEAMPITLVAGDIDRANAPFRVLGRLRLLSHMAMLLSLRVLRSGIARLDPSDPNLLTDQRIKQAFGAAQIRPPKLAADELLTESNADDDVAMTAGLAAYAATEQAPSALASVSGEH
jgi:hypothetical protein